jgi:DNA-directed RNA polymerase specialized sigma24 family protein
MTTPRDQKAGTALSLRQKASPERRAERRPDGDPEPGTTAVAKEPTLTWDQALDCWMADLQTYQLALGTRLLEAHDEACPSDRAIDRLQRLRERLHTLQERLITLFRYPLRDRYRRQVGWDEERLNDLVGRVEGVLHADLVFGYFKQRRALVGWVFQIADNMVRGDWRRAHRAALEQPLETAEVADGSSSVEDLIARSELASLIRQVVRTKLPPHQCLLIPLL